VNTRIPPGAEGILDPDQIRRVLVNLLVNAGQGIKGQGQVLIDLERGEHACQFRVRDSGPGVADDVRHQVFDPLFTTKTMGTGSAWRSAGTSRRLTAVLWCSNPPPAAALFLMIAPDMHPVAAS
jgi:signal transduction histidine kinase